MVITIDNVNNCHCSGKVARKVLNWNQTAIFIVENINVALNSASSQQAVLDNHGIYFSKMQIFGGILLYSRMAGLQKKHCWI